MPRLERTAIGVSVISRGLDDHSRIAGTTHRAMPAMGALLDPARGSSASDGDWRAHHVAGNRRRRFARGRPNARHACKLAAFRRARLAIEHGDDVGDELAEGEWLNYAALLVQVDRIVADLSAPLPA